MSWRVDGQPLRFALGHHGFSDKIGFFPEVLQANRRTPLLCLPRKMRGVLLYVSPSMNVPIAGISNDLPVDVFRFSWDRKQSAIFALAIITGYSWSVAILNVACPCSSERLSELFQCGPHSFMSVPDSRIGVMKLSRCFLQCPMKTTSDLYSSLGRGDRPSGKQNLGSNPRCVRIGDEAPNFLSSLTL